MSTYKVIINRCFGGFGLSLQAKKLGEKISGIENWGEYAWYLQRHDPVLVEVFETLGPDKASGGFADLTLCEVSGPYRIEEYDGAESIYEPEDYDYEDPSVVKDYPTGGLTG